MLCRKCGTIIAASWPFEYHTSCFPDDMVIPGMDGMTGFDLGIKDDVINIVRWAHNTSARSLQTSLGCSEVGQECDRRIAYKMAGIPPASGLGSDPWPAVVGTAIHTWMEMAVNNYQEAHSMKQWVTELEVHPSPIVKGHTDLYDRDRKAVLDWKFPSPENLKIMRKEGPSEQYMTQVQLYGLGHMKAGRAVERVGIVAAGRQGWLKDMYVHTVPYDQGAAEAALQRVYDIGQKLIEMEILDHPERWDDVPAVPGKMCFWCPWHQRSSFMADDKGCPGS